MTPLKLHITVIPTVVLALAFATQTATGATEPRKDCLAKISRDQRQFEQDLGGDIRLISRGKKDAEAFYLTHSHDTDDACGRRRMRTVLATVHPIAQTGQNVMVSFHCRNRQGRWKRGAATIAAFDARGRASYGWVVDRDAKSFSRVGPLWCRFDD